jgi:23S rRNA (guanosine2251-2'-O)-methyltransferase
MKNPSLIYGLHPVLEALEEGKEFDKVFMLNGSPNPQIRELKAKLFERGVFVKFVPLQKLNRLTSKNHQGVAAFISPIEFYDIENLLPQLFEEGKTPFILALDSITDIRNLGAITRTAECAGVDAILVPMNHMASINADAIKSSAGALLKVPICRTMNFNKSIKYLQDSGLKIVAATEKGNQAYDEIEYTEPCTIVMGSEDVGIDKDLLKISDHLAVLPMKGEIQSLNVSVATGIMLYEVVKQRIHAK